MEGIFGVGTDNREVSGTGNSSEQRTKTNLSCACSKMLLVIMCHLLKKLILYYLANGYGIRGIIHFWALGNR